MKATAELSTVVEQIHGILPTPRRLDFAPSVGSYLLRRSNPSAWKSDDSTVKGAVTKLAGHMQLFRYADTMHQLTFNVRETVHGKFNNGYAVWDFMG